MITAENLTDAEIGKLLNEYLYAKPIPDSYGVDLCDEALGRPSRYKQPAMRRTPDATRIAKARARVAEILNERAKASEDTALRHRMEAGHA